MFSCKYCKILKKTYFEEHQRTAAPGSPFISNPDFWKTELTKVDIATVNTVLYLNILERDFLDVSRCSHTIIRTWHESFRNIRPYKSLEF